MTAAVDDALLQLRGIGKVFTGVAALRHGRRFCGCERDSTYYELANQRIKHHD